MYEPMGHIPLLIAWPGAVPREINALTTSVDIHATLCDLFGVTPEHSTHGTSLLPVLSGAESSVRDYLLTGVWGREVHLVDDRFKYARAPEGANAPMSVWSNRWSTMPAGTTQLRMPKPDERAWLDRMPGSKVPVIRQPFQAGRPAPLLGKRPLLRQPPLRPPQRPRRGRKPRRRRPRERRRGPAVPGVT